MSTTEFAWLIERHIRGSVFYLYVACNGIFDWTGSNENALRLSRREDADSLCRIIEDADSVAEHMFVEPTNEN